MTPDALLALERATSVLSAMLQRLQAGKAIASTITATELSELENQILLTGECLRNLPHPSPNAAAIKRQAAQYLKDLESLRRFLPYLHQHLLEEKARLDTARNHVAGASAWAEANQETR